MLLRGALGYVLFFGGGATLAYSGGRYALGELRQADARQAWNEARARSVVSLARSTNSGMGRTFAPIVAGSPVARLVVQRLNLDEIVVEGVEDDALNAGPGHLHGSAFPGEKGNSVISAHRDRHFAKLGDLRLGDTVFTESATRRSLWLVVARRVIDKNAPALFHTTDATLTLTTCWPIRYLGGAPERLLVTAKLQAEAGSFRIAARN